MAPIGIDRSHSNLAPKTNKIKLLVLLVGVNQYQDERLPCLQYSAVDCQGLGEVLTETTLGFTQKEAIVYHDFAPQRPLLASVRHSLKQIAAAAESQDTILFYFSGHGMLEVNSQQAFLCLADTNKDNLLDTGLGFQEVLQLLGNSSAHQQLVWLDACHSGGMTLSNPTSQLVEVLQQRAQKSKEQNSKRFYALLSCDFGQQSWEFPELGHGIFTYYLMRGLRGEAANGNGVLDADGLYRYVYHQTLQYIDKINQQLRVINQQQIRKGENNIYREYPLQTPKRIVEGVGELILGKSRQKNPNSKTGRLALVVEGLAGSKTCLEISKLLGIAGGFKLEYWRSGRGNIAELRDAIATKLQAPTILLYLRGQIEQTPGSSGLILGEEMGLSRSWLRQQLRHSAAQQIIILDILENDNIKDWVEDLQLDSSPGQCLIACASPGEDRDKFAQTLLDILSAVNEEEGLSAAGAIAQLQLSLAGSGIPLYVWLSGARGIIEILPALQGQQQTEGWDLGICPYMGLSAFSEQDTQYFYGRENLTQQLINQLAHCSFLAVIGASGSGKSSAVQAGLIPQLRQGKQIPNSEQWWIKIFRPGCNPLEALSRRLVDASNPEEKAKQQLEIEGILHQGVEGFVYWIRQRTEPIIVLVIDQFEEIFTLASETDRKCFLSLVMGALEYASDRFKLIISLRADFIASCLEFPALTQALQQSSILVPPKLTYDDYRRVIINPAQQVGLKIEPELVEVLLRELTQSAADLPLLEFVLEQLWQHRSAGELTLQAYQEKLGGIQGALERSCQAIYKNLDPKIQDCAKWIFLSLTQLGEGTEDTRRRVLKSELIVKKYPAELVEKTLQILTNAKLLVINLDKDESASGNSREALSTPLNSEELTLEMLKQQTTVEVAHEVLIRHWSTLRWWLEENRARLRIFRQIEAAASLWKQSRQQSDFLLQGVRLAEAEDIYLKYTDELSEDVQKFIEAGLEQRQKQQLEQKKRLIQAQKAVVALSILGLAAFSFGGLAYWQAREANLREIEALNSSSKANLLSNQQLEALVGSVKAGKHLQNIILFPHDVQLTTINALKQATSSIQESNRLEGHSAGVISVNFSPYGQTIASTSTDKTVKLWSREGQLLKTLSGHQADVYSSSFAPDGTSIASASVDKTIKIWKISDGTLIRTLQGHTNTVNSVSYSPDGKTIASASADGKIKLWRSKDGMLLKTLPGHSSGVINISFSPDGKIIASGSEDKTVKLWRSNDGILLKTLTGHKDWINSVSFSPDGKTIASASADKTVKIWTISTGILLKTLTGHSDSIWSVSFSPDGKIIASASRDGTVKLWSRNGIELETFKGHRGGVYEVNFSPDSKTIASASMDGTIKLWRRRDSSLVEILAGHRAGVQSVSFSPDGRIVASASLDGTIKIWNSRDGTLLRTLSGHSNAIYAIIFAPQGNTIASASADKTVKLWRVSDGRLLGTFKGHTDEVNGVSFSPDGNILATASRDNSIKLWRTSNGTLLRTLKGNAEVYQVSFSPDGKIFASASADNTVKLWNSRTGILLKTIPAHNDWVYSVNFSPDGTIIASTSADKTVKLWRRSDGVLLRTLEGHKAGVYSSSFSEDGQIIVSASEDKTVKIWSLDGRLLETLPEHGAGVYSASFSPDGKMLVSGSSDGTAKLWRRDRTQIQTLELNSLMMRACNLLHDYLKTNPNLSQDDKQLCSTS